MEPYLNAKSHQAADVEMREDLDAGKASVEPISASDLLADLYYKKKSLDPVNVSLANAFICMLHIANEEGL